MGVARLSILERAVREAAAEADAEQAGREGRVAGLVDDEEDGCNVGGRPRVLDETKRAEICALLAAGCTLRTAANYVGCSVSAISKLKDRDAAFREQVAKALAEREAFPLSKVREACGRSWRAAVWLLERTVGGSYRRDCAASPVDWEREITTEVIDRGPELATRVMQKFGGESEDAFRARMLKELEPRDEVAEAMGRGRRG